MNPPVGSDQGTAALAVSSEAILDAFVAACEDAVISHDAEGNVTTWSQSAERLFGYRRA